MAPIPPWVAQLKPAEPQGIKLLSKERARSSLAVGKLTEFLFDREFLDTKAKILKVVQAEKVFDKTNNYYAGRVQRFEAALARAKRLRQLAVEHEWSLEDHNLAVDLISEPMPYGLHGTMFLVSLMQFKTWWCANNSLAHTLQSVHRPTRHEIFPKSNGL
jgi:acyl-CoA oxidase